MTKNIDKEKIVTKKKCGIVMPIANTDGYPSGHWSDVLKIIEQAIYETEFEPALVSQSLEIGLIHERIVNNLYFNDIVICDVSSKNPNVMFELGLRLAFDKPTIIIKDELTSYSFDTAPIEHLQYPSSLRYNEISEFQEELKKRVIATYTKSINEESYSPFLKSFGTKIVAKKISENEISETKYLLKLIEGLRDDIQLLKYHNSENNEKERNFLYNFATSDNIKPSRSNYMFTVYPKENYDLRQSISSIDNYLKNSISIPYDYVKGSNEENAIRFKIVELPDVTSTVIVNDLRKMAWVSKVNRSIILN